MKNIKNAYSFDFVHDTQQVFRKLLHVLANPGDVEDLSAFAEKFSKDCGCELAIAATLLDNETTFFVEQNPRLQETIHNITLAKVADYTQANYVFLSSECNYVGVEELFMNCKKGTYADPHTSTTFVVLCQQIDGLEKVILSGPGINKEKHLSLSKYVKQVIAIRQKIECEYPLGIDLFFVSSEGRVLGIPRLCVQKEEQGHGICSC